MIPELISQSEISAIVNRLGTKITLKAHNPCLWIILDGAFMFGADIIRQVGGMRKTELLKVKRDYESGEPTHPKLYYPYGHKPVFLTKYTHVLIDVVAETGGTFEFIKSELVGDRERPNIITCALIVKGTAYTPTFVGKRIEAEGFLTGYGMGPYRHLPYVAKHERR